MFQIIPRDAFSCTSNTVQPCSCDRFDYSWEHVRCERHPELGWISDRPQRAGYDLWSIYQSSLLYIPTRTFPT